MERSEGGPCKVCARACPKERRHRPPRRSEKSAGRALCRAEGPRRGVEPRRSRGRVVKAITTPPPNPNPSPQPVTEVPKQPKVTATRKRARSKKPEPKSTATTKPASGKPKKKAIASVKTAAAKPTTADLVHNAKSGHGPHSPPPGAAASPKGLEKVTYPQFATEPVWAQNPDSQPTKVYPSYN